MIPAADAAAAAVDAATAGAGRAAVWVPTRPVGREEIVGRAPGPP
ncbi:MAG: hypothetical protein ACYDEN_08545 [Acidimicrobiales bacterium]